MRKDIDISVKGFPAAKVQEDYFYWYIDLGDGNGESFYEKKEFADVKAAIREKTAHPEVERKESWSPIDDEKDEAENQPVEEEKAEEQPVDETVVSNDVDEAIPAGFQRVEEYRDNRPRRLRDSISWKGKALIAAFVVLFALAVTCPDEDAHRRVVAREVESVCGSNGIYDMFDQGSIFSDVISMFMDNVVDVVASTVEVKDCMFFSIGYLDGHPVSFGILHHVFLFADGNDFKQYLKEKSMITR